VSANARTPASNERLAPLNTSLPSIEEIEAELSRDLGDAEGDEP
jgi:hypothetical protein